MFTDRATLEITAGKGGDGIVACAEKNLFRKVAHAVEMEAGVAMLF